MRCFYFNLKQCGLMSRLIIQDHYIILSRTVPKDVFLSFQQILPELDLQSRNHYVLMSSKIHCEQHHVDKEIHIVQNQSVTLGICRVCNPAIVVGWIVKIVSICNLPTWMFSHINQIMKRNFIDLAQRFDSTTRNFWSAFQAIELSSKIDDNCTP